LDSIYVLNYIVNRQIARKGKKLVVFIDLNAVFDSVDREVLLRSMRRRGIREGLVTKMGKILRETKGRMRK